MDYPFKPKFCFCIAVLLSLCLHASEAELRSQDSQLLEQSWVAGNDNGRQLICSLLQTSQGYLWIGTDKGLIRFDGVGFTDFLAAKTPGISQGGSSFAALWEDSRGGVWAGTHGGVTHYDGRRFSTFTTRDGLPANNILRVDGDQTGVVWIYTPKGVCRWKDEKLEVVHPELDKQSPYRLLTDFPDNADITHMGLWRRSGASGMERFAYGHWRDFPLSYAEFEELSSIYEDSLHRVWLSLKTERTFYYEVAPTNSVTKYSGLPAEALVFFRDRDGFLWLTDHQAHTARWKDGMLYPVPNLKTPSLTHMIQRADGALWAGTFRTSLYLFRPRLITMIQTPGAPEIGSVLLRQRNGTVWAAGTSLLRFEGNHAITVASLSEPKRWGIARAIGEDRYGNLLLGEQSLSGLRMLSGHRIVVPSLYSAVSGVVHAILLDSAGDEWFATSNGLYRAHAREVRQVLKELPQTDWRCLLEVAPGHIWACTDSGPIRFAGGRVDPFPSGSPWTLGAVTSLAVDARGGIWIGTAGHGIVRFNDGKFRSFTAHDGLPTDTVFSIDASDPDYLWLSSDAGLIRVGKDSLLQTPGGDRAELKMMQYDEADGIPSRSMASAGNQAVLHFTDGTIWFATLEGIACVRPGVLEDVPSHTHAVIEEHVIDNLEPRGSEPDGIVLKPDQTSLEIRYTALGSYRPEQLKFRYQLVGIDNSWVPVHTRRAAFYTHLPPGGYVFRVQAADGSDGEWSPEVQVGVTVLTPFYKSWWMRLLVLVAIVSAIAIAIEMRRRSMLATQRVRQAFTHRLLTSQESERKRIARELHDGLGQHLALIRTLALLPAKYRVGDQTDPRSENQISDSLSSIADEAGVAIREVEAICYGLRPYQLDRLGLTKAVRSLLRTLDESNALFLRSSVDDIDGFFPPEVEITFYRILQEAISNILKHSEATNAEILVICDGTNLRLSIQDNGRGFSTVPGEAAGGDSLGLIGITERAEVLGGRATIESSPQTGTRIVVEVTRPRPLLDIAL